ncbi:aspartic peptidase domain-containing protein [Diaporthe sp. PMI_573]|nr:aspartic peptidase domain-containing protein [Diaporthaceae sp. PMI_573]
MSRPFAVLAVSAGLLLAPAANAAGTVQWDIQKNHPKARLGRRAADTHEGVITNELTRGGYFATCSMGTPPQNLTLQLDTGSSDIWVPWNLATVCEEKCTLGNFDPNASTTFTDAGKGTFDISYVDGSFANGDYFMDTFQIAGATVSNVTMGLGLNTTIAYGLVGVGYTLNEAIVDTENSLSAAYPNLPVVMVNEGLIGTNAYSLWLNDLDSSKGNILFGGIDTEKYIGNLTRIDTLENNKTGVFDSFLVPVTSLLAVSASGTDELTSTEFPIEVVLDSGTTLSYLPNDIAEQIWREVGATYTPEVGLALLPCRMQSSQGHFSFGFAGPDGPRINVSMDELVLDLVTSGPPPTFISGPFEGEDACEFGFQNSSKSPFLLGDTFLRSAYVVYDLMNNEIGIAQTDFNATGSNIVAFEGNGSTIPFSTLVFNQNLTTPTTAASPSFAAESGFEAGTQDNGAAVLPLGLGHTLFVGFAMLMSIFLSA